MEIKRIGVLGAGAMGNGIAQVAASSGYDVTMLDIEQRFLDKAMETIKKSLGRIVKAEKMSEEQMGQILSRIKTTTDLKEAGKDADVLIEAIPEVMELKVKFFKEVDEVAPPHTIIATNTSQFSITELATATKRTDKFIGMHWFNPPPIMRLIEVIMGVDTSEETRDTIVDLAKKLGKIPIVVNKDSRGYVVNRPFLAFVLESIRVYEEGIATKEDIDTAMKLGLNHPMGPFELMDYAGADIVYYTAKGLTETFGDRFIPPQSLTNLIKAGRLGAKTGKGWYDHTKK
jgi:3-hydroxybutyryl-CoA dehydrogenase